MSLLPNESYANIQRSLWLPASSPLPLGPTGATGPQGPQGFSSGAIYYFNKSQVDPISTLNLMERTPLFNAGQAVSVTGPTANIRFAEFITPVGDPGTSIVPPGNWIFDLVMNISVPWVNQHVYAEVYSDDGVNPPTLISSNQVDPVDIIAGPNQELYTFGVSIPTTSISPTDRIIIAFYVENLGAGEIFTCYFENGTVGQVITSLSAAIVGPSGPTGPIGATGATGPQGPVGSGGTIANYGVFTDTTTQVVNQNVIDAFTFNTTEASTGVSIGTPTSQIVFTNPGIYNIQFSAQLTVTSGSAETVSIWLRKNGVDVPRSCTDVTLNLSEYTVASWNFVESFVANDYFELMCSSNGSQAVIQAIPSRTSPVRPDTPSVILTVTQVTYTQVGPTGPTGPATDWSLYPAVTGVNMAGNDITGAAQIEASGCFIANGLYANAMAWGGATILPPLPPVPLGLLTPAGELDCIVCKFQPITKEGQVLIDGTNLTGPTDYALQSYGPAIISGNSITHTVQVSTNTVAGVDLTRIQLGFPVIGSIFMTAPSAIELLATTGTLDFAGAVNIAAGGAMSLAAGSYIEANTQSYNIINTTS